MDELIKELDETFTVLRQFVVELNNLLKVMNRMRQLCDVVTKKLEEKGNK